MSDVAFERAWSILFDEVGFEKHGQLCPYWLGRNREHPTRSLCDCWVLRKAHRQAATVLLAARPAIEAEARAAVLREVEDAIEVANQQAWLSFPATTSDHDNEVIGAALDVFRGLLSAAIDRRLEADDD